MKGYGRAWALWRKERRAWRCRHPGCLRLGAPIIFAFNGRTAEYRYSPSFCEEHEPEKEAKVREALERARKAAARRRP